MSPEFVPGPKYAKLFEEWRKNDDDFRRWFDKSDSHATQRDYFLRMAKLHADVKLAPREIVKRYGAGGKLRKDLVDDLDTYLLKMIRDGKAASARAMWTAITSLLKARGVLLSASAFEIKRPEVQIISPQYIPTQEEFEVMLRFARSARDRFITAYFRYTGARVGSVVDPEPMKLGNVLDLDFEALARGEVVFKHTTSCAILVYGSMKNGQIVRYRETYISFILPQGMQMLREYLEERIRKGQKLTGESFLFEAERVSKGKPLADSQVRRVVDEISLRAGFVLETGEARYTPHSLRRLFYNSLQGLDDVDRECLNGHIKGIRAHYHGSVDEIKRAIEFMRGKYEFGMRALVSVTSPEDQRKRAVIDYARMQGLSDEQIKGIQETIGLQASADDLRNALAQVLSLRSKQKEEQTATNGGKAYDARVIDETELVKYVEQGWEIVRELSDKKIVIRRKPS